MDDPSYLTGLNKSQFVDTHENVFPFSSNVASLEVLQLLSLFIGPSGLSDVHQQMFHFVPGTMEQHKDKTCNPECYFQSIVGIGDYSGIEVYGVHPVAEEARNARQY